MHMKKYSRWMKIIFDYAGSYISINICQAFKSVC